MATRPVCGWRIYVRRDLQDRLVPQAFGWNNVRCPNFVAQETMNLRTDARRYEAGSFNIPGIAGLNAALGLLLEVGIDAIAAISPPNARARRACRRKGMRSFSGGPDWRHHRCWREGTDMKVVGSVWPLRISSPPYVAVVMVVITSVFRLNFTIPRPISGLSAGVT